MTLQRDASYPLPEKGKMYVQWRSRVCFSVSQISNLASLTNNVLILPLFLSLLFFKVRTQSRLLELSLVTSV